MLLERGHPCLRFTGILPVLLIAAKDARAPSSRTCSFIRTFRYLRASVRGGDSLMKLVLTMFLLLVVMAGYAVGQKQKPKPCENAMTQTDMNICWGNEYKKADAALNKTYQELAAMLEEEEKAQLKTAETAWLKYRDTNCEFVADQYKGGSIRPMIAAICLADVTNNRTTELKNQIKDRKQ